MNRRIAYTSTLLSFFLFAGCSMKSLALRTTVDLLVNGTEAFYEESDPKLAEESLGNQLKLLDVLLRNDPENPNLLLLISQGFGGYAFLFFEESEPERAKGFYERGKNYGLRNLNKRLGADLASTSDLSLFDKILQKSTKKDAPILFWTAYSWGGWANLSRDNSEALADLPKVERLMMKVEELEPGYFYGGANIFLGAYYGSRPKMFGGDLEKSKAYFDKAMKASNRKFVMTQVLFARYNLVPAQDKAAFKAALDEVLNFPLKNFPEQRLSNAVAQKRAKKLLENIDEYF